MAFLICLTTIIKISLHNFLTCCKVYLHTVKILIYLSGSVHYKIVIIQTFFNTISKTVRNFIAEENFIGLIKKTKNRQKNSIYAESYKRSSSGAVKWKKFDKISVSQLCQQAEITRTTFYSHYNNISEVLDSLLDDALEIASEHTSADAPLPVCQRLTELPEYRVLFLDETLSGYIIQKIYHYEKPFLIPKLIQNASLSEKEAELLFCFLLNGSFAVNKNIGWERNELWNTFQSILIKFIHGGLDRLSGK